MLHPQAERRQAPEAQPRLERGHRTAQVDHGVADAVGTLLARARDSADQIGVPAHVLRGRGAPHRSRAPPGCRGTAMRTCCRPPRGRPPRGRGRRGPEVRHGRGGVHDRLAVEEVARQRLAHLVQVGRVDERRLDAVPGQDAPQDRDGPPYSAVPATTRDPFCVTVKKSEEIAASPEANPIADSDSSRSAIADWNASTVGLPYPASTRSRARRSGSPARTRRSSRSGTSRTGIGMLLESCSGGGGRGGVHGARLEPTTLRGSLTTGQPTSPIAPGSVPGGRGRAS